MLCSHDHFQIEFHLIMQIFYWIDLKLLRETCLQKKLKNSFQQIFKPLNTFLSFYTVHVGCSWVFLRCRGKLDTWENMEYKCDQVSEGKLGVQTFVNLSIFNGKMKPDLM